VAGAPSGECLDTALETLRKIGTEEQIALTEKLFSGKIESVAEKEKYYDLPGFLVPNSHREISPVVKLLPCVSLNSFGVL
jgi:hypothetical protein